MEVHLQSLADAFHRDGGEVVVFNTRQRENKFETPYPVIDVGRGPHRIGRITRETRHRRLRLLHAHLTAREWRLLVPLLPLRSVGVKLVVSFHSFHEGGESLSDRLAPTVLHQMNAIFASGEVVRQRWIDRGVRPDRVRLLPPFVAPRDLSPELLPDHVRQFMARHSPTLTCGASLLYSLHGREVYGTEIAVQALAILRRQHPSAGLVIHVSRVSEPQRMSVLRGLIKALELEDAVLLVEGSLPEPAALWAHGDAFLRPSWDDGDSIAVRQALWAGVPTIASDAVPRPDGVVRFSVGDPTALAEKLRILFTDLPAAREKLATLPKIDAAEALRLEYTRLTED
jgi:glycosyltransferase involved in cell wall biosynthesis